MKLGQVYGNLLMHQRPLFKTGARNRACGGAPTEPLSPSGSVAAETPDPLASIVLASLAEPASHRIDTVSCGCDLGVFHIGKKGSSKTSTTESNKVTAEAYPCHDQDSGNPVARRRPTLRRDPQTH
jgi:hypothetical protein